MKENEDKTILPLRCLWIQEGYEVYPSHALGFLNPERLQSFNSGNLVDKKIFETEFPNLENLSAMDFESRARGLLIMLTGLKKLKFYFGIFSDEEVRLDNFM